MPAASGINIWLAFQGAALREGPLLRHVNFEVLAHCLKLAFHLQKYGKVISNPHTVIGHWL